MPFDLWGFQPALAALTPPNRCHKWKTLLFSAACTKPLQIRAPVSETLWHVSPDMSSVTPKTMKYPNWKKNYTFLTSAYKMVEKVHLPYSNRSENIINRKILIFYIKAIPQKISQLRQKIFFRARPKYFLDFSGILGFGKGFLIKPL